MNSVRSLTESDLHSKLISFLLFTSLLVILALFCIASRSADTLDNSCLVWTIFFSTFDKCWSLDLVTSVFSLISEFIYLQATATE